MSTTDWELAAAALAHRLEGRRFDLIAVRFVPCEHKSVAGATRSIGMLSCTFSLAQTVGTVDFVLKTIAFSPEQEGRWRATADPAVPFYWRREADFYAQGAPWPGSPQLRSACCRHVWIGADEAKLVLELVTDPPAVEWDEATILACMEHLAEVQAVGPNPELGRCRTPFLAAYYDRRRELLDGADEHMRPTNRFTDVDALLPAKGQLERLHRNSGRALAHLATLPQVFSHNDFWQPNIFGRRGEAAPKTLLDFAYCGYETVGIDAANFIIDGAIDGLLPYERGTELFEHALWAYARRFCTLRPEIEAEELICAARLAMALKYAWLIPATFKAAHSEESLERLEKEHGSAADFLNRRAGGLGLVRSLIAEFADAFS